VIQEILQRLRKVFRYLQGNDPWLSEVLSNRVPSTKVSLESLILKVRGKEIWRQVVPLDWIIHCEAIWSHDAIIIGGHIGDSSDKLKSQVPKLKRIYVYEPIPEFFETLKARFQNNSDIHLRNFAIVKTAGPIIMDVLDDSTLARQTSRSLPQGTQTGSVEMVCHGINLKDALQEVENIRETSLLMNCEGSEYEILESLKYLPEKPFSILFQTHTTDENSYEKLYETRAQIAHDYIPIICEDWAWDIWLRKDVAPLSAIQIERNPIVNL
jgi:FkbM family methyltransferase